MTATEAATELSTRLDALIEDEKAVFLRRQTGSAAMSRRAHTLAGGATSNWQIAEPHAVWISHGAGSKVYDVDGNEYADFHGGYGVSLAGHAHPAIVEAVRRRVGQGTHFAQPTEDSIVVADNLAERFGQPLWRFGNSGTESTLDAVHLMRAATGCSPRQTRALALYLPIHWILMAILSALIFLCFIVPPAWYFSD